MLKSRTGAVLRNLIEEYIETATPVASEVIARRSLPRVSSATVRNEMAELEDEGYILRPHTSAGGVPSSKGYRFYVGTLEEDLEPTSQVKQQIRRSFGQVKWDVEAWMNQAAAVLSELSANMAIVTSPRAPSSRLKHIQIVQLQEFLALLIIVLQEARLSQQLLPLEGPVPQSELTEVANKLNLVYGGLTYNEIKTRPVELTPFERLVLEDTLSILKEKDDEADVEHSVDGLRLLLSQPEFAQEGKAKKLVEILEEKVLLRSILSEAPEPGEVAILIGEENAEEMLKPYSLILCRYGIPDEAAGVISAVGPTRMEYPNVIGGVKFLASFMSELLTSLRVRP